jgi:hypothetical protein
MSRKKPATADDLAAASARRAEAPRRAPPRSLYRLRSEGLPGRLVQVALPPGPEAAAAARQEYLLRLDLTPRPDLVVTAELIISDGGGPADGRQ